MLAHLRNGPNPEIVYTPSPYILRSEHPFEVSHGSVQDRENALMIWQGKVRDIFMTLVEWLLLENESLIKSPPPLSAKAPVRPA